MNKKNTVKMRSIARKISAEWNLRTLYHFFALDIVFVSLRCFLWRFITEAEYFGRSVFDFSGAKLCGKFHFTETMPSRAEDINNCLQYFIPGSDPICAGHMLLETSVTMAVIVIIEIWITFSGLIKGGKKVRKKLEPLNKLAETAQLLSVASFDGDKFQDLENALEKIDTNNTECHVATGNTELQGIESAINNLIERMRNSYIQQARFVSDASHELRTPISVIQGYANMLDRWGKDDEKILEEGISAIKSESEAMRKLVEQLLFLARGDNGRNQLTIEKIDLADMMEEIFDEYSMVDEKHHYILKNNNEQVITHGDYAMIKQTARILVDNASKYTPEGNDIIVSAYISENNVPAFEVQDTGIGIPADDIPKVFERFYRADDARNRKTGGTGLGLSIAKWIVDKHKGYFKLVSFLDAGTRFTVFFPELLELTNTETEEATAVTLTEKDITPEKTSSADRHPISLKKTS